MTIVYLLFVEDPWDEYYEEKFHTAFLTLEEAEAFAKSAPRGSWRVDEVPLYPEAPKSGNRYPEYRCVSKNKG